MTDVLVRLKSGIVTSLSAEGHVQNGLKGTNIVCAAVSMLLRTTAHVLCGRRELGAVADAATPGKLYVTVTQCPEDGNSWLRGVTDVLLQGLRDLEREYPKDVRLRIQEEEKGHGA